MRETAVLIILATVLIVAARLFLHGDRRSPIVPIDDADDRRGVHQGASE